MLGWRHQLCQKSAQVRVISPKLSHVQQGGEGAANDFTAGWRRRRRVGAKLPEATARSNVEIWTEPALRQQGGRWYRGSETRVRRSG